MIRLISRLAAASDTAPALAAEQIQAVVHEVLTKLQSGKSASIPGLGTFIPGAAVRFEVEKKQVERKNAKRT